MPFLYKQEEDRPYRRYKHTAEEQRAIRSKGMTPVVSSNVSAISQKGNTLYVRFHDSATYAYPKSGELYDKMLHSPSKGKFVWKNLIRANVPYRRASGLDFKLGAPLEETTTNLMEQATPKDRMTKDKGQLGLTLLAGLALSTIIDTEAFLKTGTIASLALASLINGNTTQVGI